MQDSRVFWIVLRALGPRPACGHRQSNLIAICEPTPEKTAEQLARDFCLDETYLIGPIPPNTMLPDTPVLDWPGSYYPLAAEKDTDASSDPHSP